MEERSDHPTGSAADGLGILLTNAKRGSFMIDNFTPEDEKLSEVSLHSGFPNPAADTDRNTTSLSLDRLLLHRPSSTYLFRLTGHQWAGEGIADGDIAVVDRALAAKPSDLVMAWHGDDFILAHARQLPANVPAWGVVTSIVHLYREPNDGP